MGMTWEELESACSGCQECPLGGTRTNIVIGTGNRNADIMFVGEAPGADEDRTGIPFVGAAGKHLDKFLAAVGIAREDVYIANILKCRPPNNRDPLPEEQDVCIKYLRCQVKLIRPKIIVCLGRISAMRLIDPEFRITKMHGQFFKKGDFHICAVYHPSALLRDASKNEDMYRDMKAIKKKLDELA
ncbi:MAG: uracil-DNA glycosylase [Ruminococcaceae bacterium]|nr:uracil-DNA glycosylase [Oscillospiraceae bacterium]